MDVILTIIWLASVTCVFVLIGIMASHAERELTPAHRTGYFFFRLARFASVSGAIARRS
jgi:hypothetical protein